MSGLGWDSWCSIKELHQGLRCPRGIPGHGGCLRKAGHPRTGGILIQGVEFSKEACKPSQVSRILWGQLCSGGTMSLPKSWSVREGGGNRPSKAIGLVRALFSGKMALTGKTDLSL